MCSIVGALLRDINTLEKRNDVNAILKFIWESSHERGRDGRGFIINSNVKQGLCEHRQVMPSYGRNTIPPAIDSFCESAVMIGNVRAEPTTEFVTQKSTTDQQPYSCGEWSIVHNGTVANDKELRTGELQTQIDSAAIAEQLAYVKGYTGFVNVMDKIKGSFAILATMQGNNESIFVASNYRPIWFIETPYGLFFASARDYFPDQFVPKMFPPYTAAEFNSSGLYLSATLYKTPTQGRALVVCSGGLDSVVSATYTQRVLGYDIELIHFLYGSRAQGPEVEAVKAVANELDCKLTIFPLNVYNKDDSPLLNPDCTVAGGEAGAEFAHEWVPARNLLLLSVATAFAEARGIDTIVLGNNLEEAGAYPDNEPEFIARFNDLLPFAVGDGKRMRVIMPVGNLMKHEIVALGNRVNAPMHLTWSCYRAESIHCGTCGPCFMRRKAFEMNNIKEVINYKE